MALRGRKVSCFYISGDVDFSELVTEPEYNLQIILSVFMELFSKFSHSSRREFDLMIFKDLD